MTVYANTAAVVNVSPCVEKLEVSNYQYTLYKRKDLLLVAVLLVRTAERPSVIHGNPKVKHSYEFYRTVRLLSSFMFTFKVSYYEIWSFNY